MPPLEIDSDGTGLLSRRRATVAWVETIHDISGVLIHTALLTIFETVFFWKYVAPVEVSARVHELTYYNITAHKNN